MVNVSSRFQLLHNLHLRRIEHCCRCLILDAQCSTQCLPRSVCNSLHTKCTNTPIASILNIAADQSLLDTIITGYETDDFAQQLTKDINMGSIEGATLIDKLLYVGRRLVIPWDLHVHELLYNLAHDTLGHFGFDKS